MAQLKDIIAYILKEYPHKDQLSNARVTKLIYLSDWHQSIHYGCQITKINWYFDNYGPFVWDIKKCVEKNPNLFESTDTSNRFGARKITFQIKDDSYKIELSEAEKNSIDHIINITDKLYWDAFIKLVYSTHPIATSERYSNLNLIQKATEYKNEVFPTLPA